ncbi:disulfide bond formation protein B [Rhodobacter sp. Har01]|uniref:disulfide bond formation protein B n=1 Tax=Rhodobacter sp. Har01 TaxID=2883999 RepID=UPI001D066E40|nr:disulfide bond formation protein B [Rhodobacter sp. Har01]MCB6176979.1 disulfide bond formation protein B [Rhodobacter sp. Har01]
MGVTWKLPATVAGLGSAAMLVGAFGFQILARMPPCELCLWQRWPHAAAVAVLVLALITGWRALAWAGALAALATAGIGLFHAGVEQGWWDFVSTCTQGSIGGLSGADLLNPDAALPAPVRCDEIPWSLLGISMAGWNAITSAGLAAVWVFAATRRD